MSQEEKEIQELVHKVEREMGFKKDTIEYDTEVREGRLEVVDIRLSFMWGDFDISYYPLLHLPYLEKLSIRGTFFTKGLNVLTSLPRLKYLRIENCERGDKSFLLDLTNLEYLCSYVTDITENELVNLTNLKTLHLLVDDVSDLYFIQKYNKLQTLVAIGPSTLKNLESLAYVKDTLTKLELKMNECTNLHFLEPLQNLNELGLDSLGGIEDFKILSSLKKLEKLSLYEINHLSALTTLKEYSGLKYLTLSFSPESTKIIDFVPDWHQLEHLVFKDTYRAKIKIERNFFQNLKQLQTLKMSSVALEDIQLLSALTKLSILDLAKNQITDVTPLSNLKELEELNLAENPVKNIDNFSFSNLARLKKLNLKNTGFTAMGALLELRALEELDLSENQIAELPSDLFKKLPNLKKLSLQDNPIRSIPKELFQNADEEKTCNNLRTYFHDGEVHGWDKNQELKIIVIGNGGVGKSTMVNRLINNEFNPEYDSTHGIHIQNYDALQPYNIQVWDFGGQDIYHATHRIFMQTKALFLVLWDWKTEQEPEQIIEENGKENKYVNHKLAYWLSYVAQLGRGESKALLVQTKYARDGRKSVADINDLRAKFQNILLQEAEISIDSAINDAKESGFLRLKRWIRDAIEDGEILRREELPKNWIAQRHTFQKMLTEKQQKYIDYEYFEQNVATQGQFDTQVVLQWLSDSGVIFYNSWLDKGKIIIDQEWVIDAIYTLFDREEVYYEYLENKKGRFTLEDLAKVWRNFTGEEHRIFLHFMLSAKICFIEDEWNSTHKTYIAPALLPESASEGVASHWRKAEGYFVRYDLDFFHYGLMQDFIVTLYKKQYYENEVIFNVQELWRYGAQVSCLGYLYLIEVYPLENRITVRTADKKVEVKPFLDFLRKLLMESLKLSSRVSYSLDGKTFNSDFDSFKDTDIYELAFAEEGQITVQNMENMLIKINNIEQLLRTLTQGQREIIAKLNTIISEFRTIKQDQSLDLELKIEKLANLIDKTSVQNLEHYQEQAKHLLAKFEDLQENSRNFMAIGFYLLDTLPIQTDEFSPAVLQFCRTLENELLGALKAFKAQQNGVFDSSEDLDKVYKQVTGWFKDLIEGKHITLSQGKGIIEHALILEKDSQNFKQLKDFLMIGRASDESLKQAISVINQIVDKKGKDYRNKSAHTEPLGKQEAEDCKQLVINALNLWLEASQK
ncbi:MAG: leucine-rich repeat domain-containing protein [Bernardetiaceae bacterium]|nr:leucine-rich repeat domain-containing protein [Bernardetiaceae bacterium]